MSSTGQSIKSVHTTKGEKYHFHGIHKDSSSGLFQSSIKPQLHRSLRTGSSLALLLYGQTGAGKTFTMIGEGRGLLQLSLREIFLWHSAVEVSYLQVYNEQVEDLLKKGAAVNIDREEWYRVQVCSFEEALLLLKVGEGRRVYG